MLLAQRLEANSGMHLNLAGGGVSNANSAPLKMIMMGALMEGAVLMFVPYGSREFAREAVFQRAVFNNSTLSVCSQVKSWSSRPKWP